MNITLIGMPASGKTRVGKILAEKIGYTFIDPDKILETEYGMPLQEVLQKLGDAAFLAKEADATRLSTRGRNQCVIATGGSIVYSEDAMEYLADISFIIYLVVPLTTLVERIGQKPRGIVGADKKPLTELFGERDALYKKWANVSINADAAPEKVLPGILPVLPERT